MTKKNFEGKFLSKLSKIDRQDIESFLGHLVREKHLLEVVFNAIHDGVVVLSPALQVMYTNDAALEMLGIGDRRRIVGQRVQDLVTQDELREFIARFVLRRAAVTNEEIVLQGPAHRSIVVSLIPLEAEPTQQAEIVVMLLRDLTRERTLEKDRRRAERSATLTTLAAGLAHEIKNPLNSLQIHAQLMQRALREEEANPSRRTDRQRLLQSSQIIVEEIQRLGNVVNEFLTAVRPTRPLKEKADINTLVGKVVSTLEPEADARGIEVAARLDHEIPPAEFDAAQVTQAVINMLKNAFDAVEGRTESRVEVRTAMAEDSYMIQVSDNGVGIPEESMQRILEPYFTTKETGTGLGLAIISRIVEEHGGRLDISSTPGAGTVVSLLFPLEVRPVRLLNPAPAEA